MWLLWLLRQTVWLITGMQTPVMIIRWHQFIHYFQYFLVEALRGWSTSGWVLVMFSLPFSFRLSLQVSDVNFTPLSWFLLIPSEFFSLSGPVSALSRSRFSWVFGMQSVFLPLLLTIHSATIQNRSDWLIIGTFVSMILVVSFFIDFQMICSYETLNRWFCSLPIRTNSDMNAAAGDQTWKRLEISTKLKEMTCYWRNGTIKNPVYSHTNILVWSDVNMYLHSLEVTNISLGDANQNINMMTRTLLENCYRNWFPFTVISVLNKLRL